MLPAFSYCDHSSDKWVLPVIAFDYVLMPSRGFPCLDLWGQRSESN